MRLASYHVHTKFCDGGNTIEEMTVAAIAAGMTDIGFSAHAAWPFSSDWNMQCSRYNEYVAEVARVREAYAGRIAVKLGFEADYLPGFSAPAPSFYSRFNPDYLIGSVHFVPSGRKDTQAPPWPVDAPVAEVKRGIDECFGGDGKRAVQTYWGAIREMVSCCAFDIIGHLDLPRKRNGELKFFDEESSWYLKELRETVKTIARSGKIVEINTGAIARKAMDDVYPSPALLDMLYRAGVPITINSDAHSSADITCAYNRARAAARKAGYSTLSYLDGSVWVQEIF